MVLTNRRKKRATNVITNQGTKEDLKSDPAFGVWADRADMQDVRQVVRAIRKRRKPLGGVI